MRKVIVLVSALALVVLGSIYLAERSEPITHGGSPAYQALLTTAIARLEGATEQITAASIGEAHASGQQETTAGEPTCTGTITCAGAATCYGYDTCTRPGCDWTYVVSEATCDPGLQTCDAVVTCMRFYTCDSQYTCHGEQTCDGCYTCWASTCDKLEMTCDGSLTCDETDPSCTPHTFEGWYTCDGTVTCEWGWTCEGWPECGGNPSGTERTSWGELKKEFSE